MEKVENQKVRMAVLIGGGSKLYPIYDYAKHPAAKAEIVLVTSFKRNSSGLAWAQEKGLPTVPHFWLDWKKKGYSREQFDEALSQMLADYKAEIVVLAGWGLILTAPFLNRWADVTINLHPALLTDTLQDYVNLEDGRAIPVFRGNHAIELAWQAKVDTTGCTIHYVTPAMDVGPVILKKEVPVLPEDTLETLADRVHAAEDEILPRGIELAAQDILTRKK